MGSDPMAVVDHRLRVHGLQGLRVADASIMPVITSGNTSIRDEKNCPTLIITPPISTAKRRKLRAIFNKRWLRFLLANPRKPIRDKINSQNAKLNITLAKKIVILR